MKKKKNSQPRSQNFLYKVRLGLFNVSCFAIIVGYEHHNKPDLYRKC